jgi:hypothetical protein
MLYVFAHEYNFLKTRLPLYKRRGNLVLSDSAEGFRLCAGAKAIHGTSSSMISLSGADQTRPEKMRRGGCVVKLPERP